MERDHQEVSVKEEACRVTLPKLGESILSATVVQWFKKVGDTVALDEPLLEVTTDKVNSEIPSPVAGTLIQILALPDQELQVGDLLALIAKAPSLSLKEESPPSFSCSQKEMPQPFSGEKNDFFSPALLRLAKEKGISLQELEAIEATGACGRLTKKDLESYVENNQRPPVEKPRSQEIASIEHIKMSSMRKAIADNMVKSFYGAPHATLVTEVDVTKALKHIQQKKDELRAEGIKLTITAVVARALVKALEKYPLLNSSLEGDTIVLKKFINLGIAVSVDQGVLVPVIKNCQTLSLRELAKEIGDLSSRTRAGEVTSKEMQEGTITLTNFGISGVEIGIPIIRYPEVAIIGIGAIQKKVVVLDDDSFGIRSCMHISLTFDHRVLDGMYGCGFLNALKAAIEE